MKKILVVGKNSYIGKSFGEFLQQWPDQYHVDAISVRDDSWRTLSFNGYDCIFHLAGLAHIKETHENRHLYYEIDRDLPIEIAKKASLEGVKQFIFMSSMSVYGLETGVITPETIPSPKTNYGIAKIQAELAIKALEHDYFKVCILRPPMVYGKGCKGNFNGVVRLVKMLPIFPKVNNKRSMLYIENLCSFVKKVIDEEYTGLYFPQNREYMNTTQLAKWISDGIGKKVYMSLMLGLGVRLLQLVSAKSRKGFGTLIYKGLEKHNFDYCTGELEESVKRSV